MAHDQRILKHEEQIADLKARIPAWISTLPRPATPALIPLRFGACRYVLFESKAVSPWVR